MPGNVPYLLTAGAMTDSYTPAERRDHLLASLSATGPTLEGLVKREMVAPGGYVTAMMSGGSQIPTEHRELHDARECFTRFGISPVRRGGLRGGGAAAGWPHAQPG